MKKFKTLVVDDNKEFTKNVLEYFKDNAVLEVTDAINDGSQVIDYLKSNPDIDLIFLDLLMPKMDGVAILEAMAKNHICKRVIVLSSFIEEYAMRMMRKYHVDYYMLKPVSFPSLAKRAEEVLNASDLTINLAIDQDLEIKTSELLHNLGVPSQIKGYQYLREGILMLYQSTDFIGSITSNLYPEIARRHDTTATRVERAIRHAIEISWNRGDYQVMNKLFGHSIDFDRSKPTNSEFLVTVSDALRLGNKAIFNT